MLPSSQPNLCFCRLNVVSPQDLYRKDCNLAAQLLQCNKSLYRAQLSEVNSPLTLRGLNPNFLPLITSFHPFSEIPHWSAPQFSCCFSFTFWTHNNDRTFRLFGTGVWYEPDEYLKKKHNYIFISAVRYEWKVSGAVLRWSKKICCLVRNREVNFPIVSHKR